MNKEGLDMHPFRCQICGESYLGPVAPERCPFCGAAGKFMVVASLWVSHGKQELCEQSIRDVRRAIELELNNNVFYLCARRKAQNQITEAIFARLAKQELEHAELLAEMLGEEMGEKPAVDCSELDEENFLEAHRREKRASIFYLDVARRAPEARMKEIFYALADIETEHLKISNLYR
jgi:rubrerythrin